MQVDAAITDTQLDAAITERHVLMIIWQQIQELLASGAVDEAIR